MSLYSDTEWMSEKQYVEHLLTTHPNWSDHDIRSALVEQIVRSDIFFMRNYLYTLDKETRNLTLQDPFAGQTAINIARRAAKKRGLPQMLVFIKPRKVGWTQEVLAETQHELLTPNTLALIMVPDLKDVVPDLALRFYTFINNMGAGSLLGHDFMSLKRRISNLGAIVFDQPNPDMSITDPGLNSRVVFSAPGEKRGVMSPNVVDFEEFAKYDNPGVVLDGVLSGIALNQNTVVYINTTPRGHDDFYEPLVEEAVERNPLWMKALMDPDILTRAHLISGAAGEPEAPEGYMPVFWPFWKHENYCTRDVHPMGELPALTDKQRKLLEYGEKGTERIGTVEEFGGEEELMLMRQYKLPLGRIWWRRRKIKSYVGSDKAIKLLTFRQEFAATYWDCFVDYGAAPFDPLGLDILAHQVRDPYATGILRRDENGEVVLDTSWRSDWGGWRIYRTPDDGEAYCMGCDLGVAYGSKDADPSVAIIIRRRDNCIVAVLECKFPPHDVRDQLHYAYRWYNRCLTAVEVAGATPGYHMVRELFKMGVTNQYYWKRLDADVPKVSDYLGWETMDKTRPIMQSKMIECIGARENGKPAPRLVCTDRKTYRELASVRRDPGGLSEGKIEAVGKNHDDHFVALSIAVTVNDDPYHGWRDHMSHGEKVRERPAGALMQAVYSKHRSEILEESLAD